MIEQMYYWCFEITFLVSGIIYAYVRERRENFVRRILCCCMVYGVACTMLNLFFMGTDLSFRLLVRMVGFVLMLLFQHICWEISWTVAVYEGIWAFMSWQLIYELCIGFGEMGEGFFARATWQGVCGVVAIFAAGLGIAAVTVAKWLTNDAPKKIGPRQLISAVLIFATFQIIGLSPGSVELSPRDGEWQVLYMSQLLLAFILYLQNELFKNSVMRQELAVMNLLWKKEQEQYELSKENIALINQKCHDLKHQIRAIRNCSKEDVEQYLAEMEDSIRIYEAIVKTGNEVLDTILTEKSLYCKNRGIVVSCVADGSQMDFINTVDLYAILGNALDNAIEAVEKFKHKEKRQIDVMIYRQQNFLVMNIVNPIKGNLVYEEELPVSTKGDKRFHGFGLRSMRYLVKKYDGFLTVSEEDGCFSLKILIPIPKPST